MTPETIERRRRRIVAAALGLVDASDLDALNMDAVAAAADLTKPTLYRYFPTKEALLLAVLDAALDQVTADVGAIIDAPGPAEARLRRVVALVFERIGRIAPALRALEGRSPELGDLSRQTLRAGFRALRARLTDLLDEGVASGTFRPADTRLAALAVLGATRMSAFGAAHMGVFDGARTGASGAGEARVAGAVADLLLGGLARRPDPPARAGRHSGVHA